MLDPGPEVFAAVDALRVRGIDSPEMFLESATPAEILIICRRWDRRKNVGPGLLIKMLHDRDFDSGLKFSRPVFADYEARYPVSTIAEPHTRLQARRGYCDDPCPGVMVVIDVCEPLIVVRCSECGYEAAFSGRALSVLPLSGIAIPAGAQQASERDGEIFTAPCVECGRLISRRLPSLDSPFGPLLRRLALLCNGCTP
jgi:hypothetical protein